MMHKVWCSIEELLYCFSRSFIKFQGHTGWLIDDFNPVWVRLLGKSQYQIPQICLMMVLLEKVANCHKMWWLKHNDWQLFKYEGNIKAFNHIISDYLWSYGDHSISTFVYWFIYLFIYQSIYLIHNISPVHRPCTCQVSEAVVEWCFTNSHIV